MALRVSVKIFKFSVASQCGLCRKVLDRIKVRGLLKESSASKISDFEISPLLPCTHPGSQLPHFCSSAGQVAECDTPGEARCGSRALAQCGTLGAQLWVSKFS